MRSDRNDDPNEAALHELIERIRIPECVGDRDLPCQRCGYNLRGLGTRGNCPECGGPVWTAFLERTLAVADPTWLKNISSGMRWLVAALIVLLATVSLGSIAASFDRGGRFVYLPVLGCAVLAASVSIGLWKLSSRNPALTASPQSGVSDCVVARITLAISMLGLAVSLAIGFASGFGSMPAGIAMLASPYGISGGVFFYSMARVIEKLAVLAEDKFAIGRVRQYRIGFVISWCPFWGTLLTLPVAPGPVVCVTLLAATCALMFAVLIVCSPAYLSESLKAARAYADAVTQDPETALGQVECVDD